MYQSTLPEDNLSLLWVGVAVVRYLRYATDEPRSLHGPCGSIYTWGREVAAELPFDASQLVLVVTGCYTVRKEKLLASMGQSGRGCWGGFALCTGGDEHHVRSLQPHPLRCESAAGMDCHTAIALGGAGMIARRTTFTPPI